MTTPLQELATALEAYVMPNRAADAFSLATLIQNHIAEIAGIEIHAALRAHHKVNHMADETAEAIALANKLLDEPNCDPDDDLRTLARQLLRAHERIESTECIIRQVARDTFGKDMTPKEFAEASSYDS